MGPAESDFLHAGIEPIVSRRSFLVSAIALSAANILAGAGIATSEETGVVDPGGAEEWLSVLLAMFPHPGLPRDLYAPAAEALVGAAGQDEAVRSLLAGGRRALVAAAGGGWEQADDSQKIEAITAIVGTPLFVLLRQTTVFTFYNDPRVWEFFGYDGDAWRIGGWLTEGVDTIDWLPDVPAAKDMLDGS